MEAAEKEALSATKDFIEQVVHNLLKWESSAYYGTNKERTHVTAL